MEGVVLVYKGVGGGEELVLGVGGDDETHSSTEYDVEKKF